MRGEQFRLFTPAMVYKGSPPLARGTEFYFLVYKSRVRITPACAGNSDKARGQSPEGRDHPRLRGEQVIGLLKLCYALGSPPLARGTDAARGHLCAAAGITPACAGNSGCSAGVTPSRWDHPRLRGEQASSMTLTSRVIGSPPLARGTVRTGIFQPVNSGITPACAGNSNLVIYQCHKAGDHPRLRGEQSFSIFYSLRGLGSPPLARGTEREPQHEELEARITPACAGNRRPPEACRNHQRDHPRLRGEQEDWTGREIKAMGSPPLARGTDSCLLFLL